MAMARNAGRRCFSMQTPSPDTNTKPTNVRMEKNPNHRDTNSAEYCAGFIFLCDESTKLDCFKYRVLGLSDEKKNIMGAIRKGTCLFLFDIQLRLLYGIYAASSCTAFQLEPDAFGGNSPWQVKFCIEKECLPLSEHVFKASFKNNYIAEGRFKTRLSAEQVHKLVSMFSPLPGGPVQHPTALNGRCIQDTHTQRYLPPTCTCVADKADGLNQSGPLSWLNLEPILPLNDAVVSKKCTHGYYVARANPLPPAPASEATLTHRCLQSDPVLRKDHMHTYLHHDLTHLIDDDSVVTKRCMHGHHAPIAKCAISPPIPREAVKAAEFIQSGCLPWVSQEPTHPLSDAVMHDKYMHGYHALTTQYVQMCGADDPPSLAQHCKEGCEAYLSHLEENSISPGHNHPNPSCGPLCAICPASKLQMTEPSRIRTRADLYPGHTCGHSAAHMNSHVYKQRHPTSDAIQGNLLDRKLNVGEPLIDSSSLCQHAEIAPKSRQNAGVSNALPAEEYRKAMTQKRSLQETYARANGERPPKCMYHQVRRRPLDDTFGGAIDAATPNGYNPWL